MEQLTKSIDILLLKIPEVESKCQKKKKGKKKRKDEALDNQSKENQSPNSVASAFGW